MPTYNYQCIGCGNIVEIIQKMSDSTIETLKCTKCKKVQGVRRIIRGGSGMIFKGSGFYLTDYTKYGKKTEKKPLESKSKTNEPAIKDNNNKKKED